MSLKKCEKQIDFDFVASDIKQLIQYQAICSTSLSNNVQRDNIMLIDSNLSPTKPTSYEYKP